MKQNKKTKVQSKNPRTWNSIHKKAFERADGIKLTKLLLPVTHLPAY